MKSKRLSLMGVVAAVGATLPLSAGLVAKWDFNNYDSANPTSVNVMRATVGGAGAESWSVSIDGLDECAGACNACKRNFFSDPSEPLTVIDGVEHLLLGADENGEDNLLYVDWVELYDEYMEPEL